MGMMDARTNDSLAALQLLKGLPPDALADVRAAARIRRVPRNARLFNQGDGPVRAHALIDGYIRISQSGSDGAQVVMRFIRPGDLFGSVALFTDGRYPADADALTDLTEVSWSETDLAQLMDRHHRIATNFIGIIGRRLEEVQNRVRELATQRVEQRIAHTMLRLVRHGGHPTADGITIAFPLRRKDIADICGTTLHSASRTITRWEKAGWLTTRDQRVTVCNLSEIELVAEADQP